MLTHPHLVLKISRSIDATNYFNFFDTPSGSLEVHSRSCGHNFHSTFFYFINLKARVLKRFKMPFLKQENKVWSFKGSVRSVPKSYSLHVSQNKAQRQSSHLKSKYCIYLPPTNKKYKKNYVYFVFDKCLVFFTSHLLCSSPLTYCVLHISYFIWGQFEFKKFQILSRVANK